MFVNFNFQNYVLIKKKIKVNMINYHIRIFSNFFWHDSLNGKLPYNGYQAHINANKR